MLNRKLSMAWEKWQQTAQEMRDQAELLMYGLRTFLNHKMVQAWNTWRFWANDHGRQQFLVGGCINRMLHRKLSMAWEKWQYVYIWMKRLSLLMRIVPKMFQLSQGALFDYWAIVTRTTKKHLKDAQEVWVEPILSPKNKSPIARPTRERKSRNFTNLGDLQKMHMSKFMKTLVKKEALNDGTIEKHIQKIDKIDR